MLMLAVALVAQMGGSSDFRRTMAAGGEDAVLMFPPETVCGAEASEMTWTGDGKQLVLVRRATDLSPRDVTTAYAQKTPPRATAHSDLIVWDVRTRKPKTVLTVGETAAVSGLEPVPGTDKVVVNLIEVTRDANGTQTGVTESIGLLSAGTSTLVRLNAHSDSDPFFDQAMVSSTKPIVILRRMMKDRSSSLVRFIDGSGRMSPAFQFPYKTPIGFDASGVPGKIIRQDGPDGKRTFKFHKLNTATGQEMGVVDYLPDFPRNPDDRMTAIAGSGTSTGRAITPTILLQLKGGKDDELGVVTTDGSRPLISPSREAIAYVSQGSAMVRLFAPVPHLVYEQGRLAAERTQALNAGKQVGLALIMFAGDMDDTLPGQDVDLRSKLGPYTKNPSLFDNFTYTFGGGAMTSIENPATTSIGYVTGPGGRAMIYADGHVKWQPDAP